MDPFIATPDTLDALPAAFDALARARQQTPVLHDPTTGSWHLFRYADIDRVLLDNAAFSSVEPSQPGVPPVPEEFGMSILGMDPPRHRQLRALVSQAFTPRAIGELRPRIARLSQELIDAARANGAGRMEFIAEFAEPLPVTVIAELLGVPAERRHDFKRWSDEVVSADEVRNAVGMTAMADFFREQIAFRRHHTTDDLLGGLVIAEIDGERLSEAEVVAFAILLLVAGNETTTNLLGNAIICLDAHPDIFTQVHANPDLIPGVIEETLRWLPPVWQLGRFAREGAMVGETPIPAGSRVIPWLTAANRDPERFPDPDRFDPERSPNKHLAFGRGIHACLGAPLSRLEAAIVLPMLIAQLPDLRRVPGVPVPLVAGGGFVFGPKSLPVEFTPN
jgi:cytochrome P450